MATKKELKHAIKIMKVFGKYCRKESLSRGEKRIKYDHDDLVKSFLIWWKSKPTMQEFHDMMNYCTVFSEFVYIMSTEKWD